MLPGNIPALERNIGDFATIVPAALTYDRDVALLNAVYPGCVSTGGSTVISRDQLNEFMNQNPQGGAGEHGNRVDNDNNSALRAPHSELPYWLDGRPLATITLEELMAQTQIDRIDVLKLDCEGSEFSILENTGSLDRIGAIVGEFHGRKRFDDLVRRKFSDWRLRILRDEDPGTFWLINPRSVGNGLRAVPRSVGNTLCGVPPAAPAAPAADSRV
ncbi:MAG: FkbM family methyltransferase [Terriglobales bacterium]